MKHLYVGLLVVVLLLTVFLPVSAETANADGASLTGSCSITTQPGSVTIAGQATVTIASQELRQEILEERAEVYAQIFVHFAPAKDENGFVVNEIPGASKSLLVNRMVLESGNLTFSFGGTVAAVDICEGCTQIDYQIFVRKLIRHDDGTSEWKWTSSGEVGPVECFAIPCPTETATPTVTVTFTVTITITPTATQTPEPSPTATPTVPPTDTATPTATKQPTETPTTTTTGTVPPGTPPPTVPGSPTPTVPPTTPPPSTVEVTPSVTPVPSPSPTGVNIVVEGDGGGEVPAPTAGDNILAVAIAIVALVVAGALVFWCYRGRA